MIDIEVMSWMAYKNVIGDAFQNLPAKQKASADAFEWEYIVSCFQLEIFQWWSLGSTRLSFGCKFETSTSMNKNKRDKSEQKLTNVNRSLIPMQLYDNQMRENAQGKMWKVTGQRVVMV